MKFRVTDIEIPPDNLYKYDALQRKPVVEFVRDLIKKLDGPFVLTLDSPWGTGKTTFVRMLRAALGQDNVRSVYFNAWEVDYVADPLVPMVAALDRLKLADSKSDGTFRGHMETVKKVATTIAKRGVVAAAKVVTFGALDLQEAAEDVAADLSGRLADDLIGVFEREQESLARFRGAIESALLDVCAEESTAPLVFFIDELDRCRPSFAIELLERIKHLFNVQGIIFVLSVDKDQLEAITAAVYGERIDAQEYLRRFIDLEFGLPMPDAKMFTRALLKRFEMLEKFQERAKVNELRGDYEQFENAFSVLADLFELSLRARERCVSRLAVVLSVTSVNEFLDPILAAFLIVVRAKRPSLYRRIVSGSYGPEETMQALEDLPKWQLFSTTRTSRIIECYLFAGDVDSDRRDDYRNRLLEVAQRESDISSGIRAQELVELQKHIPPNMFYRGSFSLSWLAGKIDIASRIKD